jgi:probable phosphoglycerate mutase
MKNIYIVRHGQTDYNVKGIVQGRGVDSSLNEIGEKQAQCFYEYYKIIPFDMIFISTLKRTYQTIQAFKDLHIPIEKHEGLDEIDWGIYEGVEHDAIVSSIYFDTLKKWSQGDLNIAVEGAETPLELQERQRPFISLLKTLPYKNILVCTHGRSIRALLCTLTGKPLSAMDTFPHSNTCLYQLIYSDDNFQVIKANDLSHLEFHKELCLL